MSEHPNIEASLEQSKKRSSKGKVLLLALIVLIAGAGLGAYRWRTSHERVEAPRVKAIMHLETFVLNIDGADSQAYLRVGIDLGLTRDPKEAEKNETTPSPAKARDIILDVLSTASTEQISTTAGKRELKAKLTGALNERAPELRVHELYFTEFLIQGQ